MARTYTQAEKDAAIASCIERGMKATHDETGIPKATLSSWMTPEQRAEMNERFTSKTSTATAAASALAEEHRVTMRATLIERATRMLDRMTEPEIDFRGKDADKVVFPEASAAACKSFATAAAILIDKYRLEVGEVTDRTETVAAPERTPDQEAELAKVVELAERRAA